MHPAPCLALPPSNAASLESKQSEAALRAPPSPLRLQASNLGAAKAAMPFWKTLLLGVVAGLYVGLCAALLMTVGPNCPGIAAQNPGLAKYITAAIGEGAGPGWGHLWWRCLWRVV